MSAAAAALERGDQVSTPRRDREHDYQRLQRILRELAEAHAPSSARLVMTGLLSFSNPQRDTWDVWPCETTLQQLTGLSRRSVQRAIVWLETHGFLHRTAQGGQAGVQRGPTHYRLDAAQLPPNVSSLPPRTGQSGAQTGADLPATGVTMTRVAAPDRRHHDAGTGVTMTPLPASPCRPNVPIGTSQKEQLPPSPPSSLPDNDGQQRGDAEFLKDDPGAPPSSSAENPTHPEQPARALVIALYAGLGLGPEKLTLTMRRREVAIARELLESGATCSEAKRWARESAENLTRRAPIDMRAFERERAGWLAQRRAKGFAETDGYIA